MSFIQREIDRIGEALRHPQSGSHYAELYAAQQALAWASEPTGFASPFVMIMGIPEGLKDCPSASNPEPS
ncbi:MAG TPA: hypothetical protein VFS63_15870 [Pseudolabrys sp.]|nr:hypothetical protein [Pseudolabrys sp.]